VASDQHQPVSPRAIATLLLHKKTKEPRTENREPIVAVKAALTVQRQSPRLSVPTLFGTIAVPHKHL